jgi:VWFA-related protein
VKLVNLKLRTSNFEHRSSKFVVRSSKFSSEAVVAILLACVHAASQAAQQAPTFRAATDLVVVDARVVDRDGRAIPDLRVEDFDVRVDGTPRPIVSLEFQSATAGSADRSAPQTSTVMILVDRLNIRPDTSRGTLDGAATFVEHLPESHRVGLVTMPDGKPSQPIGGSRAAIARDLRRMLGTYSGRTPPSEGELFAIRSMLSQTIGKVAALDGRRTVVYLADRSDPIVGAVDLATRAMLQGVTFHVVSADAPVITSEVMSPSRTPAEDDGLGALAGATGGLYLRRAAGAASIFDRIAGELVGQYLLTFAAQPDGDRGRHKISVSVKRDGASVHARREFVR